MCAKPNIILNVLTLLAGLPNRDFIVSAIMESIGAINVSDVISPADLTLNIVHQSIVARVHEA